MLPVALLLFAVALLAALIVVAVYEVRGRITRSRGPEPAASADAGEPLFATSGPDSERLVNPLRESCGELRRLYPARCRGALPSKAPAQGLPPPADGPAHQGSEERAIAELTAWLSPSAAELANMARRCEVRFALPALSENQPPAVTDEQASTLSLSSKERALLERTLRNLHADLREFSARALGEVAGGPGGAAGLTMEEMLADLERRPENGFEEARQQLAQERAGLALPPKPGARQPPGERLLRLWARMGDELERRLADGLGAERAHQLRFSPHAVWMNRFVRSGCLSLPTP